MNAKQASGWGAALTLCAMPLLLVVGIGASHLAWHRLACTRDASIIAHGSARYDVEVSGETCNSAGIASFVRVKLKGGGALGADSTVLVYEPVDNGNDEDDANQPPEVRWLSPEHLQIDVHTAALVDRQETFSHGVTISYHIANLKPSERLLTMAKLHRSPRVASL